MEGLKSDRGFPTQPWAGSPSGAWRGGRSSRHPREASLGPARPRLLAEKSSAPTQPGSDRHLV